jgi:hypothetical protein
MNRVDCGANVEVECAIYPGVGADAMLQKAGRYDNCPTDAHSGTDAIIFQVGPERTFESISAAIDRQ